MDSNKDSPETASNPTTSNTGEMEIDLGYAEYTDAYSEAEELDENDIIDDLDNSDTPILTERVEDDLHNQNIAKLEAIVFGEDVQAEPEPEPKPQASSTEAPAAKPEIREQHTTATAPEIPPQPSVKVTPLASEPNPKIHPSVPLTAKGENPFLPKHIMDRLNQGRNLVEEIAQSSAALDASTAILRTHARAERMNKPVYGESQRQNYNNSSASKSERQRQALIDDLVEEYLPLIAAELRRRLNRMVD